MFSVFSSSSFSINCISLVARALGIVGKKINKPPIALEHHCAGPTLDPLAALCIFRMKEWDQID